MTVADRIKERRESLGMTQIQLADKMGYKGKSSISKIESAGDKVTLKTVEKASIALNCAPSYLMGWVDASIEFGQIKDSDLPNWAKHPERLGDARDVTREVDASRAQTPEELWLLGAWRALGTDQREAVANLLSTFLSQKTGSASLPENEASA